MARTSTPKTAVIVPNWNGKDDLPACLDSLLAQSVTTDIIVVENGSIDGSIELIEDKYPSVILLKQPVNLGFSGGVNVGLQYAIDNKYSFAALFNNDAVADKHWLEHLVDELAKHPHIGIAACKFMTIDRSHLDSTGDTYTNWGLPFPRGRGESGLDKYDKRLDIFGASGGSSLYRIAMLEQIGLFDEDFFAYYEDVDISFRAQLAGWPVRFVPQSVAYHQIGGTSGKIRGFTTMQFMKNIPWTYWKNVPRELLWIIGIRLFFAYTMFYGRAILRGQFVPATKGALRSVALLPKKLRERRIIQRSKTVSTNYIRSIIVWDLPPNAANLRKLRRLVRPLFFWR